MIPQAFIKQTAPFSIFLIYLVMRDSKYGDKIINGSVYIAPAIYITASYLGYSFVEGSWRTIATPIQYTVFFWLIYRQNPDKPYYSLALATNTTLFAGYFYEIPRYFNLQGLMGLIRVNKYSLFHIDYAIISIIPITYMVWNRINLDEKTANATLLYLIYVAFYLFHSETLYNLKYEYAWIGPIRTPWICLIRLPALYLLYTLLRVDNDLHQDQEAEETIRNID